MKLLDRGAERVMRKEKRKKLQRRIESKPHFKACEVALWYVYICLLTSFVSYTNASRQRKKGSVGFVQLRMQK